MFKHGMALFVATMFSIFIDIIFFAKLMLTIYRTYSWLSPVQNSVPTTYTFLSLYSAVLQLDW